MCPDTRAGTAICIVSRCSGLNPGSTWRTDTKLRSSRPPQTVSVIASATSATISADRARRLTADAVARVPSRSESWARDFAAVIAGRSPTITPVTIESTRAKTKTGVPGETSPSRGRSDGAAASIARIASSMMPRPAAPPATDSITLSTSIC